MKPTFTTTLSKDEVTTVPSINDEPVFTDIPKEMTKTDGNQDPYTAQGKNFQMTQNNQEKDPYQEIGSHLRVHHPVQPKTQVEKWSEEIKENRRVQDSHYDKYLHRDRGYCECKECCEREDKIAELERLIKEKTDTRYLNRYPVGRFEDNKVSVWEKIKLWIKR